MIRLKSLFFLSILLFLGSLGPASAQNDPVAEALHARLEELQFAGNLTLLLVQSQAFKELSRLRQGHVADVDD